MAVCRPALRAAVLAELADCNMRGAASNGVAICNEATTAACPVPQASHALQESWLNCGLWHENSWEVRMQDVIYNRGQVPRQKGAKRKPFKIVVVYDGFADLIRAYDTWATLTARFRKQIQIVTSAWNFAMLRDPSLRQKAALHTADADMIVLSASGRSDLPAHVRNWIRSWIPWKKGRSDALVAVLDEQSPLSATAAQLRNYLRRKAEQTGMDFFCNADHGQPRMAAV